MRPNPSRETREVAAGVAATRTGRSSAIMAAGTFVSRILGFARQWLLVAAIGGFGIADAFNTANTLPNTLYNLLAGGVLNAILVPTIVRALSKNRGKEGTDQVNALLTLASIILLGMVVVTVMLALPIVMLYGGGMPDDLFNLTVIFALWCLPQIFFYGTYALLGQVLNSLSSFGPYMWAPVVNNVIGITGLVLFIRLYGTAPAENFDTSTWDAPKIALLAGSMTLGIALQALVLLFPLKRLGFQLRANFQWRGLGFRHTGKVAAWAFAGIFANALMNLIATRIGSEANGAGNLAGEFYPATSLFGYATMLYMLPQSLVTISVSTAVFTAMAYHATQNDFPALSEDYLKALRLSSLFTILLAGMLIVGALPLANFTASALPPEQAQALATVLVILSLGIPGQTIFSTNTRVFYSLEDTRTQFLVTLPAPVLTGLFALVARFALPPDYWLEVTLIGEPLSLLVGGLIGLALLRRRGISAHVIRDASSHYLRCLVAVVLAGIPAWLVLYGVFEVPDENYTIADTFFSGFIRSLLVGFIMGSLYFFLTWVFNVTEVRDTVKTFADKVGRRPAGTATLGENERSAMSTDTSATESASWKADTRNVFSQSFADARQAAQDNDNAVKVAAEESKLTVKIVAVGVALVCIIALVVWFWPRPQATTANETLDLSPQSELKVVPDAAPAPLPIAGVTSISGKNDGWDNAEMAPLAIDGKPETSWRTDAMRTSTLVDGRGFGLAINLGEAPVKVRKVIVTSSAKGGVLELRQTTAQDPSGGTLLGSLPLADTVTYELAEPVETNQLVLWSTEMPTGPGGGFRLTVSEVQVLG